MSGGAELGVVQLYKSFGARLVLDNIDLTCPRGTVTGIVGRNGSGKSTLLKCITGQLISDSGAIVLDGATLPPEAPWRRARRGIAWTFQHVSMPVRIKVAELLELAHDLPSTASLKTEADDLNVALSAFKGQLWTELSFGQRKLAALAIAVARSPRMLLLDEPVAGLSAGYLDIIAKTLRAQANSGCTILIVEHNKEFLGQLVDAIAILARGRIAFYGRPGAAFESDAIMEALI